MDKLRALKKAVGEATGADREVDGLLWALADPDAYARNCLFRGMKYAGHVHTKAEKTARIKWSAATFAPAYTATFDAAISLAEKMLPSMNCWGLERHPNGKKKIEAGEPPVVFDAFLSRNYTSENDHWVEEAKAPTAPLAILKALLSALIPSSHEGE